MDNVTVKAGAAVRYSILDSRVTIGENATVGAYRLDAAEVTVVGADVQVAAGEKVPAGAMLSDV
jgi:ADP-glucose pyrophosphorylase